MRKAIIISPLIALFCALCIYFLSRDTPQRLNIPIGSIDTTQVATITIDLNSPPISSFSDMVEEAFYIPLEEMEHSKIIRMTDLFIDDEHIVVVDKEGQKVVGFDFDGRYLFDVYKKGKADYEYRYMEDASYDREKNEILVVDTKRYTWYDLNGNFLRSFKSTYDYPHAVAILENSNIAHYSEYTNRDNSIAPASLNILDASGKLHSRFLPARTDTRISLSLGNYSRLNGRLPHTLFSRSYSNDIYELASSSKVNLKYQVDFGPHNFPENYASTVLTNSSLDWAQIRKFEYDNKWARLFASGLETESFLFIPFHFQKKTFYAYYSKKSKSVRYYNAKNANDLGGVTIYPMDIKDDYFVSFSSVDELKESVKSGKVTSPEIIGAINKLTNTNNPVLCLVKLKAF